MNFSPIFEGACASLVAYWVVSLLKGPQERRIARILRMCLVVPLVLMFWGDNHGWPFAVRYFLLCVSMFSVMIEFCLRPGSPTRWEIFAGIALPLFMLAFGTLDSSITITIPISK